MPPPPARPCPSCGDALLLRTLPGHHAGSVDIDFCFGCQGIWFDHQENLQLSPESIVAMFKEMHQHQGDRRGPLAGTLRCAQCRKIGRASCRERVCT